MTVSASPFKAVVFAGGGNRCLWQVGFWEAVAPEIGLRPRVAAAVSAGAAMACALLCGRGRFALDYLKEKLARNPANFYPRNLLTKQKVFPHYDMYRQALLDVLDEQAFTRLQSGPEVRILLARPPRWAGGTLGVGVGFLSYTLEKMIRRPLHPHYASRLGFRPVAVRVSQCSGPRQLAELILASSCTPPVLPKMCWNGFPVLDGGLVDNVPLAALDPEEGPTLILLTRRYPPDRLETPPDRVYLQPSRPVEVSKWDYTDSGGLQSAYDLGRRDGELFLAEGPQALQK